MTGFLYVISDWCLGLSCVTVKETAGLHEKD